VVLRFFINSPFDRAQISWSFGLSPESNIRKGEVASPVPDDSAILPHAATRPRTWESGHGAPSPACSATDVARDHLLRPPCCILLDQNRAVTETVSTLSRVSRRADPAPASVQTEQGNAPAQDVPDADEQVSGPFGVVAGPDLRDHEAWTVPKRRR
jgi:hypothetical protein